MIPLHHIKANPLHHGKNFPETHVLYDTCLTTESFSQSLETGRKTTHLYFVRNHIINVRAASSYHSIVCIVPSLTLAFAVRTVTVHGSLLSLIQLFSFRSNHLLQPSISQPRSVPGGGPSRQRSFGKRHLQIPCCSDWGFPRGSNQIGTFGDSHPLC